jgi:hypothetical protein
MDLVRWVSLHHLILRDQTLASNAIMALIATGAAFIVASKRGVIGFSIV